MAHSYVPFEMKTDENMDVEYWETSKLIPYARNAKLHDNQQISRIAGSIKEFGFNDPVEISSDGVIIAGHGRVLAAQLLDIKEVPVIIHSHLTESQRRAYGLLNNRLSDIGGGWDKELLNLELDDLKIEEFDLSCFDEISDENFANFDDDSETVDHEYISLNDKFVVPPFSILDTRQGYWRERSKKWKIIIGDNAESREDKLGGLKAFNTASYSGNRLSSSMLDPVLSEIINLWFTPNENSNTFDCFAGDSVFGYVSSYLGHNFTGIELREEQVKLNQQRIDDSELSGKYICDDGQNVGNHLKENSQDLLFSCPPYFDLEVYSDLPNDASNQKEYSDFLTILDNAFSSAIKCLKNNRFAVVVVGNIRDKKGFYYYFVDDIKRIFKQNEMPFYNDGVLINNGGSTAIRASAHFPNSRKLTKTHQNVLVFFKGDPHKIKKEFKEIEVDYTDFLKDIEDESE